MPRVHWGVLLGLFCRNETSSQDSFQVACSSGLKDMCPSVYESQAGRQSPELFEVLWSCKWRSVPLLSGTFLFAMARLHLHHSRFCNPVPQGPGMDRSCVFISPLCRIGQMGRWRMDGSGHCSCHSSMVETPNMGDRKTPGSCRHTELARNVDVKS